MSALEEEILSRFYLLDQTAKERVLARLEQETAIQKTQPEKKPFDYSAWFADIEQLREQIRTNHGGVFPDIDVVGILRDIRDGEDE